MNNSDKKHSVLKIVVKFILSVIAAVGLTCNMTDLVMELDGYMKKFPSFIRAIFSMVLAINHDRLYVSLIIAAVFILLLYTGRFSFERRDKVIAAVFSVFFSVMQIIAISFDTTNNADYIRVSWFALIRACIFTTAYFIVWYHISLLVMRWFDNLIKNEKLFGEALSEYDMKKNVIKTAGILFLCWLPYYILLFPGTGNGDTSRQIIMFFHERKDMLLDYSPNVADDVYITNMHPFFTTIIFGLFAKLGISVFGHIEVGVGIYTFIQMTLYALVFGATLCYFEKLGMKKGFKKVLNIFVALCPLFPLYSICMLKDTMFALTYLVLTLALFEIYRSKGEVLRKKSFVICLFADAMLFTLTKNQGVYFLIVILIVSMIVYRRRFVGILVAFGLPVIFFMGLWTPVILPAAKVAQGGKQEMLGALFQCTARYLVYYPEEVTEEEIKAIDGVLSYEEIPKLYSPQLQDPVKFTFKQDSTSEDMKNYFKAFFSMFKKHPLCYVDAIINNAFGFFDVSRMSKMAYTYFWNKIDKDNKLNVGGAFPKIQKMGYKLIFFVQRIPVINIFLSVGTYTMLSIFLILLMIRNKNYSKLYPALVTILSILILVISPAGGNFRYTMPMFMLLVFNLALTSFKTKEIKDEENSKKIS